MKKRILLVVAMVAMLICVLAISTSAVTPNNDGEKYVALDKTTLALYDVDGNPLAWFYTESTGYVALRVGIDFTFTLSSGRELRNDSAINYAEGVSYSFTTSNAVLLNLRAYTQITYFSGGWSGTSIQAIYCANKLAWINKNTFQNTASLKVFDIPTDTDVASTTFGGFSFARSGIEEIFIPKTAVFELSPYGGSCTFEFATSLKRVVFADDAQIEMKGLTFNGCTSLTAISLPESVTSLSGRRDFYNCTSLTAVYLPKGLTSVSTVGGTDNGTFSGCTNMYLVNDPFTYDNIPAKPDVYYFPEGVTSIGCELFKNCQNINKTIVFGSKFNTVTDGWAFSNTEFGNDDTNGNLVFLGDMENLTTTSWTGNIKLYFCNEADKSTSDFTKITGSHAKVFCNADGNNAHLANPVKTEKTNPDCITNVFETTYCFCGTKIGTNEVKNSALGHEFDVEKGATKLSSAYADYTKAGKLTVKCARCAENNSDTEIAPIITSFQGISTKINGDGLTIDYIVNYEALEAYSTLNGVDVELGFVVSAYDKTGDKPLDNESAVKAPVLTWKYESDNSNVVKYTGLSFRLEGNWDQSVDLDGNGEKETSMKDVIFCMAGYIIDNGAISYINANGTGEVADFNSYNGVTSLE